jgi:predicted alpha/beta hydrolase
VARGYLAATFDYRGIGESAPATLRGFQVDIRDWATQAVACSCRSGSLLAECCKK